MTTRRVAIGLAAALAVSAFACGGRTGALGGFDDNHGSGAVAGQPVGGSGTAPESGVASTGIASTGTVVSAGTTGTPAIAGSPVASGTVAPSGHPAGSGTEVPTGSSSGVVSVFPSGATSGSASGTTIPVGPIGIPPAVAMGCDGLCAKENAAMCPNQGPIATCVLGCRLLLNNPACAGQAQALFACAQTSTVSCDGSGKASLDACGIQTLAAAACVLQSDNDPALQGPCSKYCAESAMAHCPNDNPSGCVAGCEVVGNLIPACDPLWQSYVICSDQPLVCGNDGKASAPGCLLQGLAYLACTAQGATTVEDAGVGR